LFAVIATALPSSVFAQYSPQKFNVSGALFQSNGLPVTNGSVDFKIEILDPAGACVLYSEDHLAQDLNASKGGFALEVGSGANGHNAVANTATLGWSIFANNGATTIQDGSCGGTVTFNPGDQRLIRVSYNTGSGLTAMTPNVPISSAAFAMVADTLDGKSSAEFVQVRDDVGTDLNQTNIENIFSAANYAKLLHLLNNTFTSGYSFNGQRVTDVATPTAGTDAVNRDYATTHIGTNTVDFTGIGSGVGTGRTLVWDGTQWITGVPNAVDASKLPLAGGTMSGPITMGGQQIYNTGHITMGDQTLLQLGTFTTAQEVALSLAGADAGKILYNSNMGAVRMWNGSGFSGFAPSGAAGGDLTGSYPSPTIRLDAVDSAKVHSAGIATNRLVSSDATTGTTLRFVGCPVNQVMTFDGAGGWTCTTVQTLIGASGVTGGPFGTSTSVARFGVNAQGAVTLAQEIGIAFPVTTVAGRTGNVTLTAADISFLDLATVTQVVAGNALVGGGGPGVVTIGVDEAQIQIDPTQINQYGAAANQILKWNGLAWLPANDVDTGITNVVAGFGLLGGGTNATVTVSLDNSAVSIPSTSITQTAAGVGQVLKWNGSHWLPQDDAGAAGVVTSVGTGPGLAGGPITSTGSIYLTLTSVGSGSYGSATQVGSFIVDEYGRLQGAANQNIILPTTSLTQTAAAVQQVLKWNGSAWLPADDNNAGGDITDVIAGQGMTGGGTTGAVTIGLGDTAATPGAFGSATQVATYTVDQQGRLTASAQTAIAIPSTSITQTAAAAGQALKWNGTHWLPANDTDTGILNVVPGTGLFGGGSTPSVTVGLDDTAVVVGTYGTANQVSRFTVDQKGRITSASEMPIAIPGTQITQTGAGVGQVLKWNGSAWLPQNDAGAAGVVTEIGTGPGLVGGPITTSGSISLALTSVGSGSYGSTTQVATFVVDEYGRLQNAGNQNILVPTTSLTQTSATAQQVLKWNGSAWLPADDTDTGIVTLTPIAPVLVSGPATAKTISVDTGVTTGKLVQVDTGDRLPIIDGSQLTNVNAVALQGRAVSDAAPAATQVLGFNGSRWIPVTPTFGTVTTVETGTGLVGGPVAQYGTISLADTAVTLGTYGTANQSAFFTVDQQGRLTAAGAVNIALPTQQLTQSGAAAQQVLKWNGTHWLPAADVDTGITALSGDVTASGSGSVAATILPGAVTTAKIADNAVTSAKFNATGIAVGRLLITDNNDGSTVAYADACGANQVLKFNSTYGWQCANDAGSAGVVTEIGTGPGLVGGPIFTSGSISLSLTSVGSGSYGSQTQVATFIVDEYGRLQNAGNQSILVPTTSLTQTSAAAQQVLKWNGSAWLPADDNNAGGDITDVIAGQGMTGGGTAGAVTIGLGDTAATPGAFGSATQVATYTVDQQGRLTASAQTAIAIPTTQLTQTAAASGQSLKWNGLAWLPANDTDTDTGITALSGDVTASGSGSVAANILPGAVTTAKIADNAVTSAKFNATGIAVGRLLITDNNDGSTVAYADACAANQVLKFNSTYGWQCANDAGSAGVVTEIGTGPGLVGGPIFTSGSISLSLTSVGSGSYGSATQVSSFIVDSYGRLQGANNQAILIPPPRSRSRARAPTKFSSGTARTGHRKMMWAWPRLRPPTAYY